MPEENNQAAAKAKSFFEKAEKLAEELKTLGIEVPPEMIKQMEQMMKSGVGGRGGPGGGPGGKGGGRGERGDKSQGGPGRSPDQ